MRTFLPLATLFLLMGCQGGGDDGIDQGAVEKAQAPLQAAAKRTGGDWSKMTDAEKKPFLDRARGNEAAAKSVAGMMGSGPPGSAHKQGS